MFVLGEKTGFGNIMTEYYTGSTYIFQHEYFPNIDNDINKAKVYTTKARAENACNKLITKVGRLFEVIEV